MNLQLQDKVILVAGASDGLGFAIADALAEEGACLLLGARDVVKLEEAVAKLQAKTTRPVRAQTLDVTNADSIQAWVTYAKAKLGNIYGLVVNGGGPAPGYFQDLDDAAWDKGYQLLLKSAVHLIHAVLPDLERAKLGSVLAVTSGAVKEPIPHLLLSNVFRSGVTALVKSLAEHYASQAIRFNTIAPGYFATARVDALNQEIAKRDGISAKDVRAQAETKIPMGRYGEPQEFGRAAAFLLSPVASYITGESLQIDGGLTHGY
jgi:3-oxoacyl-[acyl-carrier protein] reductase